MPKVLHFVSGLPRAGSSLLCNLLAQHPDVHATGTSGLHGIGYIARGYFETQEFRALPDPEAGSAMFYNVLRAGYSAAYDGLTDRPVVVDKGRSWIGHLDMLFRIFPDAKVLVPVRDIRGVLASMEAKFRAHPEVMLGMEKANPANWTTPEKRATGWLQSPPVGIALERVHSAAQRFPRRLHFVHFEQLTAAPAETMAAIWRYLGMDAPRHDFEQVIQYTAEHELGFPYGDHAVRRTVAPVAPRWNEMLGREFSSVIQNKFNWVTALQVHELRSNQPERAREAH